MAVLAVLAITVFPALRVSRSPAQMNADLTAAQALTQAELARVLEDRHCGMQRSSRPAGPSHWRAAII